MCTRQILILCAAAAMAACSIEHIDFKLPDAPGGAALAENCTIPGDEDGNGLADCSDPACAGAPACQARCGNGRLEPGEECDDGQANADNADCTASCRVNVCGDGHLDTVGPLHLEVCDDGNTTDGDACSHCTFGSGCGNGIIDVDTHGNRLEECDDGNIDNNDDCRTDCVVNRCGDGVLDSNGTHKEQCDAAPPQSGGSRTVTPTETAGCNSDCTIPSCGDGKVNHSFTPPGAAGPEQCDNGAGNNADNRDCTAHCRVNVCGDGLHDTAGPLHAEACDDGNDIDFDGCSNNCTLPRCGNGIVDQGEECDDGNTDNNDDCRSDCVINRCGDGVRNIRGTHTEACDAAPPQSGGSRVVTPTEAAGCNSDCTIPSCGDGKVNHSFTPPGAAGPEQCDAGAASNADNRDCTARCRVNVCGDGLRNTIGPSHIEACDDGNNIDADGCSNHCTLPSCGNGIVDQGEECDDGNTDNNDDCRVDCVINRCGDGILDIHGVHVEQCDAAPVQTGGSRVVIPTESASCNLDCTAPRCGDGKVNHSFIPPGAAGPEQCDNGQANADNTDCTVSCQINVCGDGHVDTNGSHLEECDEGASNGTPGHICSTTCHVIFCGNGIIDSGEFCDDRNTSACGTCNAACLVVTSAIRASATLFAAPGAAYTVGDTFTLNDGFSSRTFEFTAGTPAGGNIKIAVDSNPTTDSGQMALRIAVSVSNSGLRIDATQIGTTGIVSLVNRQPSSSGNTVITETVATPIFFLSSAFAGGQAGNCTNTTGCVVDADCLSNHCNATSHTCTACVANADCASKLCNSTTGQCQVCTQNIECGVGRICNSGTCQ